LSVERKTPPDPRPAKILASLTAREKTKVSFTGAGVWTHWAFNIPWQQIKKGRISIRTKYFT